MKTNLHYLAYAYGMESEGVKSQSNGKITRVSGDIIGADFKFQIVCTWKNEETLKQSRLAYIITLEKDGAFWDRIDQQWFVTTNYDTFWEKVQSEVDETSVQA